MSTRATAEVIADRAYSMSKAENFRRRLHDDGDPTEPVEGAAAHARNDARAQAFRWSEHTTGVFRCPFCAMRAKSRALNPKTVSLDATHVNVAAPEAMTKCCHGFLTLRLEERDAHQKIPYVTNAWFTSYSRRNVLESVNTEWVVW